MYIWSKTFQSVCSRILVCVWSLVWQIRRIEPGLVCMLHICIVIATHSYGILRAITVGYGDSSPWNKGHFGLQDKIYLYTVSLQCHCKQSLIVCTSEIKVNTTESLTGRKREYTTYARYCQCFCTCQKQVVTWKGTCDLEAIKLKCSNLHYYAGHNDNAISIWVCWCYQKVHPPWESC